jgi:DNA polymerase (family 10)
VVHDRFTIAARLREIAALLSLEGENRFKVRAYKRGAEALEHLTHDDLGAMVREDRLTEIEGVGSSISSVIRELFVEGTSSKLDEVRRRIPRGLLELSKLEGIGDVRLRALHEGLKISDLDALRRALDAGRVRSLRGFGAKTEQQIREALARYEANAERLRLLDALEERDRIIRHVEQHADTMRVETAGGLRRWHESVDAIELVTASRDPRSSVEHFTRFAEVLRVESVSDTEASVRLLNGTRARIAAVDPRRFAIAWIVHTGSVEHVAKLSAWAAERKIALASLEGESEEHIYRRLGLAFVPPELREGGDEIDLAQTLQPIGLVRDEDLRGFVHCHTDYSDGVASLKEMAEAADVLGAEYMTVTDHSPSAFYARGVEIDRLKKQWEEIDEVQAGVRVKLLRGTEADILADGSLDYPDAILEKLDVVIASIHSRHKLDPAAMTERIVRAMRHPLFKIWGHALGRLVLRRDPIACDVERILDVIAEERAAIEISGDPNRLELEPRWIRPARDRGIRFVISVDAHSTRALRYQTLGVHIARRGGVRADEVLNTLSFASFREAVRPSA